MAAKEASFTYSLDRNKLRQVRRRDVTIGRRLNGLAPGLTPRSIFEKFAAVQMIDVHIPTSDGRQLQLTRDTQPEPELMLLLDWLKHELPQQPPPKITATQAAGATTL